jgi:hypothetical protein
VFLVRTDIGRLFRLRTPSIHAIWDGYETERRKMRYPRDGRRQAALRRAAVEDWIAIQDLFLKIPLHIFK